MNFTEVISPNGEASLIDVNNPPTLIRRGVLSIKTKVNNEVKETPVYIVELAEELTGTDVVSVYKVKEIGDSIQKDYIEEKVTPRFKSTTYLGELAQKIKGRSIKEQRRVETKPPLFLAPVVNGIDTFTGIEGKGFYEREEDRHILLPDGKPGIAYGDNTGVFIGLSSIKWDKAYVDVESITKGYLSQKQIWFNLDGQRPQFRSEAL